MWVENGVPVEKPPGAWLAYNPPAELQDSQLKILAARLLRNI